MNKKKYLYVICALILAGLALVLINDNQTETTVTVGAEQAEEERIKSMLETLDGVSDVRVLITFESEPSVKSGSFENGGYSDEKIIKGIAVSAKGGDDILISEKIKSLLCAAYDIPERAVFVCGK